MNQLDPLLETLLTENDNYDAASAHEKNLRAPKKPKYIESDDLPECSDRTYYP